MPSPKHALITGATSGIGKAISLALLKEGYHITGLSRTINDTTFSHPRFTPLPIDLTDLASLENHLSPLLHTPIDLLINNAGVGHFGMHEHLTPKAIMEMGILNLTVPMMLTRFLLPALKKTKGSVIHIASASALKPSPFGAAYSATKAGLIQFSDSLFEEIRKSGMRSTVISPDITDTAFFETLSFYPDKDPLSYLLAEDIAAQILWLLDQPENVALTHLQIKPQRHKIAKRQAIRE